MPQFKYDIFSNFQTMCTALLVLLANWRASILTFFFILSIGWSHSGRKYVVYQIYRLTWGFHFLTEAIHKKGNPFDKKLSRSHI